MLGSGCFWPVWHKISYQDFGSQDQDFGSQDLGIPSGETSGADLIYRCMHDTCIYIYIYIFFFSTDIYSTSPFLAIFANYHAEYEYTYYITFGHLPSYLTSMFEDLIRQQMSSDEKPVFYYFVCLYIGTTMVHYKDPYEPISVMEALTIHGTGIFSYILA